MDNNDLKSQYEKKYAPYLEGFYAIAIRELAPYPEQYAEFKKQWQDREYRWAFLPYATLENQHSFQLSEEEKRIVTEFYGLFVN